MQPTDAIEIEVNNALRPHLNNSQVQWRVQRYTEKHLTGADTTMVLVSFVMSGFFGGLLSSAGKDFWERVKGLFRRLKQRNAWRPAIACLGSSFSLVSSDSQQ